MTSIKLYYQEEQDLRRIRVENIQELTLKDVQMHIETCFPQIVSQWNDFGLNYIDDEGDQVTISKDNDVKEAIRLMSSIGKTLRIQIFRRKDRLNADSEGIRDRLKLTLSQLDQYLPHYPCPDHLLNIREQFREILQDPQGIEALIDIIVMPQFTNTVMNAIEMIGEIGEKAELKGAVIYLVSSGQLEAMTSELVMKYPLARSFVESVASFASLEEVQDEIQEENDTSSSEVMAETSETPAAEESEADPLQMMLQLVMGTENPVVADLTDAQAAEVLFNLGIPASEVQGLNLAQRIEYVGRLQQQFKISVVLPAEEEPIQSLPLPDEKEEQIQVESTLNDEQEQVTEASVEEEVHFDAQGDEFDSAFVADIALPDGTTCRPGEAIKKIWRLKNTGKAPWPVGTRLIRVGGDRLNEREIEIYVPQVLPNEEMDIPVDLTAPMEAGRYIGYWRLADDSNQHFGHRVWVDVLVVPAENETITLTPQMQTQEAVVSSEEERPSPPSPPVERWSGELAELATMGFTDKEKNVALLDQTKGNIQLVIHQLLG